MNLFNILVITFTLTVINFSLFFKFSEKIKNLLLLVSMLGLIAGTLINTGPINFIYLLLSFISVLLFLIAFLSSRSSIYLLAIISLTLVPIFLILKLDNIAESFAVLVYFGLLLGVLKDILYEKIFKN